jgi:GDP-4-dehydro-6-deoxy-D-mannose reductase
VILVRPFAHTGPGQTEAYVAPAFAARLREAQAAGAATVPTGNLAPVRDLLDVRDVVDAYAALLAHGRPGETYNVASGTGVSVGDVFCRLARLLECDAEPVPDPDLARAADVPHLVGDATKLRAETGWAPRYSLDQTLSALLHAETH